ncbi:unnamed protein product [Paramecium pentaurelia]|uniref:HTH myb-type domain-containing protein n=1 Tax=Paramecium pentaurelia TaxID=43138 RepID=A0A8S1TQG4_9CILI|nr:unnamed protein product [Paramecium pentaurelia]
MISIKYQYEDSEELNICEQASNSFLLFNQTTQSQETNATISKTIKKKTHSRRKCYIYGDKDRSSALYKYIKEKQRSYLDLNSKAYNSTFTPEEDRILLLLVKKLGPKFQKITKYFPGKTMNMLKNRYYKSLKNSEASIIPLNNKYQKFVFQIQSKPNNQRIQTLINGHIECIQQILNQTEKIKLIKIKSLKIKRVFIYLYLQNNFIVKIIGMSLNYIIHQIIVL